MQDSGCLWIGWYFSVFSLDLLHPHFLGVLKSRLLGHISAQNRRAAAWNLRFSNLPGWFQYTWNLGNTCYWNSHQECSQWMLWGRRMAGRRWNGGSNSEGRRGSLWMKEGGVCGMPWLAHMGGKRKRKELSDITIRTLSFRGQGAWGAIHRNSCNIWLSLSTCRIPLHL